MTHYFETPPPDHDIRQFRAVLRGREFHFITDRGVFSRDRVDPGTTLLIETMALAPTDTVLDLGCGFGPVGVVAAHLAAQGCVHLVDRNPRAVALARENLALNGLWNAAVHEGDGTAPVGSVVFDVAALNPPIRAGRAVVLDLMRQAHSVLRPGGRLYFVARTKQGAVTLARHCAHLFGNCEELEKASGYRVYGVTRADTG